MGYKLSIARKKVAIIFFNVLFVVETSFHSIQPKHNTYHIPQCNAFNLTFHYECDERTGRKNTTKVQFMVAQRALFLKTGALHSIPEHIPSLIDALNSQHLLNNGFPGKFTALTGFCSVCPILSGAGDLKARGLIMINLTSANRFSSLTILISDAQHVCYFILGRQIFTPYGKLVVTLVFQLSLRVNYQCLVL